jgi:hypothetical protein
MSQDDFNEKAETVVATDHKPTGKSSRRGHQKKKVDDNEKGSAGDGDTDVKASGSTALTPVSMIELFRYAH